MLVKNGPMGAPSGGWPVKQVPENDNVVIAFLGVEDLSPQRIDPKESPSIYRFTGAFRISQ